MENYSLLNQMRKDAVKIFNAGLEAVKPETCIHGCCRLKNNTFFVNQQAYNGHEADPETPGQPINKYRNSYS